MNVCVSVQTFQDGYSNLLILLFFENIDLSVDREDSLTS